MTKPYWFRDVHKQMQKSMKEETDAIRLYQQRALQARQGGYGKVADMYNLIRKEEEHHLEEFVEAIETLHP